MFSWLRKKNPRTALQQRYEATMRAARDIQRRGDIVAYAAKVAEAEAVRRQLDALDAADSGAGLDTNPPRG
jgi:hypothetical protein